MKAFGEKKGARLPVPATSALLLLLAPSSKLSRG